MEVPGSEREMPADLVLLAMGFVSPVQSVLEAFGVEKDARGNAQGVDRRRRQLRHQRAEGLRRRRHAPRPVARRLGDPRGPAMRPRGGRLPHGVFRAAALAERERREAGEPVLAVVVPARRRAASPPRDAFSASSSYPSCAKHQARDRHRPSRWLCFGVGVIGHGRRLGERAGSSGRKRLHPGGELRLRQHLAS